MTYFYLLLGIAALIVSVVFITLICNDKVKNDFMLISFVLLSVMGIGTIIFSSFLFKNEAIKEFINTNEYQRLIEPVNINIGDSLNYILPADTNATNKIR